MKFSQYPRSFESCNHCGKRGTRWVHTAICEDCFEKPPVHNLDWWLERYQVTYEVTDGMVVIKDSGLVARLELWELTDKMPVVEDGYIYMVAKLGSI